VKNKRHRGSEGGLLDDTAATLRIHFGRSKPSRNSAIANVIMAANGAAVSTQKIHKFRGATNKLESAGAVESFVSSEETTPRPTRASEHSGRLRQHVSGRLKIPEPSLLGFGSVARIAHLSPTASPERTELERITVDALPSPQTVHFLIHFKQPCRWQRHCQSCHSRQTRGAGKSGRVVSGHSHQSGLFSFSISLSSAFQDGADADVTTSLLPGSHNLAYKKKGGMREKSRQMMKYVHEQRAARTLSIIVGAFIICWLPFFIVSPFMAICAQVSTLSSLLLAKLHAVAVREEPGRCVCRHYLGWPSQLNVEPVDIFALQSRLSKGPKSHKDATQHRLRPTCLHYTTLGAA